MIKSRVFSISYNKEDKGVAEVIGAILLFAVLITLFTSFMVWYIPAQTAANETHYEIQNKGAIGSLVSDLHSNTITAGSTISASIPLGISGVSIFSQPVDTQFAILPQGTSFSASLSLSLFMNLTGSKGNTTHYLNLSYNIAGEMESTVNTQYITAIDYLVEDGSLIQVYSNSQPSVNLGPLPLGLTGTSGGHSLSLSAVSITGSSEIFSSTSSQVVNLLVNTSTAYNLLNGSSISFAGSSYTIDNMSLRSLNYTFNGTMVDAWNYAFYSQYNNSRIPYSSIVSLPTWNFAGEPLIATAKGSTFSVTYSGNMLLDSYSSQYLVCQGE